MVYKTIKKQIMILGCILVILTLIYFFITKSKNFTLSKREAFESNLNQEVDTETTQSNANDLNKYGIDSQPSEPVSGSSKKMMSDSKSVPIDNGVCENARDPVSVCVNYDSCCTIHPGSQTHGDATAFTPVGVSGTSSDNCVCQNPVNKDCQSIYKDCLADKYLSDANMDYISAGKKDVICKKIKENCCKSVLYTQTPKRSDYETVTMHMPDTYSKSLCSFSGNEVDTIAVCKQSCSLNDKCQSIVYNKGMGHCDIYDKPLITKPGFLKNDTDMQTIQFQRINKTEGFQPNTNNSSTASTASTASEYCYNDGIGDGKGDGKGYETVNGSCYKKNSIVTDCRDQFNKCVNRDIPGLSAMKKKEHCANIYGSCCSIVDGLNVVDRFKFLDAEVGAGNPKNKLCSSTVSTLDECKTKCLEAPNCTYIYSNLGIPGMSNKNANRCDLYSGKPVAGAIPSFSKSGASGKFIYKKTEINPDDELQLQRD